MAELTHEADNLRYPTGRYTSPATFTGTDTAAWISAIDALPLWLDVIIENLDAAQLETPYRPGGWTMIQTIHHLADSHMNAFIRLKLALTEDTPTIKPYDEAAWADTAEVFTVPVNMSITLLHALHRRWTALLRSLDAEQWARSYFHPESQQQVPIWDMTAMYAWHGRHHMEQLRRLKDRSGW